MSKYTTEVRFICESYAGKTQSTGLSEISDIIDQARSKIFDFKYPIFDTEYKAPLETKILTHYYTREISEETVALWKLRLRDKLNMIMPYYNKLYKSELLEFNPMYDVDLYTDRTSTGESNTDDSGNSSLTTDTNNDTVLKSSSNGTIRVLSSDTPQGALTGVDAENYLTNAQKTISDDSVSNNTNVIGNTKTTGTTMNKRVDNSIDTYTEHVRGKTAGASYSARLKEFRETFLNIDTMIINELEDLFFNLW